MDSLRTRTERAWRAARPDLDTTPMTVVGRINQISAALDLAVEPIYAAAGVSATEVRLLVPLRHSAGISAIRLSEQLNMTRAGVSKALKALESRGLVTRRPKPEDRRSALVELTETGAELIDDVFASELHTHAELLASLGDHYARVAESLRILANSVCRTAD